MFVLLALACSSVDLGGAAEFGSVLSAHWYVQEELGEFYYLDNDAFVGPDPGLYDTLVLRDYAWSCVAEQSFVSRWVALSEEALAAEGTEARCDAMGQIARHLESRRDRYNRLSVYSNEFTGATPSPGTTEALGFVLLNADDGNACGSWNPDTCAYDASDDTCGQDDRYFDLETKLTIDAASGASVAGTLEGNLQDWTTGNTSRLEASFRAAVCTLPPLSPLIVP